MPKKQPNKKELRFKVTPCKADIFFKEDEEDITHGVIDQLKGFSRAFMRFNITIEGLNPGVKWYGFTLYIPYVSQAEVDKGILPGKVILSGFSVSFEGLPDKNGWQKNLEKYISEDVFTFQQVLEPYKFTKEEYLNLLKYWPDTTKEPDPQIYDYVGRWLQEILQEILEKAGYTVTTEPHYFPAPTTMGLVAPVFSLGLQKEVEPIEVREKYETTFIYLSHEKPQSKAQIQLRLFDSIPEERLKELQRSFKDNLSPYGLKCLYLAIEECSYNKRNPWFILDTNKCLDLMGYKRNKKNVHQTNNKKRLLKEFEALTQINFNIERREPKGKGNKDKAIKFQAPLLSITGKFEEWEVERDKPIETGKLIKENVQIFLHPEIYKYINNWYTIIPKAFLTIDARSKPHAILLYSYIANQWRIGLNQYQGTIKQSIRQLLDGAGLLSRLPRRANQQRDFVKKIKDDLRWLKSQPVFWIKDVSFEAKKVPIFDQTVIITIADDHPLRSLMKKQIKTG